MIKRFLAGAACIICALDTAGLALGVRPQGMFTAESLWLYWVFSASWFLTGLSVWCSGAEP
ncbi:hypothetical protein LJR009_001613 [Bosea sp. LjRoot9]|uniref:hypothetical protein n=1 Tax=Bosea sp. LjRoot9 TaxID=3342341 RepID=UPI003ECD1CBD